MLFSTIISPESDGIIEEGSIDCLIKSIDKLYKDYSLDIKYRNVDPLRIKKLATNAKNVSFSRINNESYIVGKNREYFKLTNFIDVFQKSKNGLICFLDTDIVMAKPIELDLDFDIAFTLRYNASETEITNLGVFFVNKTKDNSSRIIDFLVNMVSSTRKLDMANPDSINFWKFMGLPELNSHLGYLDDYIVSQDFINSICYKRGWHSTGLNNFNGLRFKLLNSDYNMPWYFDQEIDPEVMVYHLKGRRNNKLERAKKLMELLC